MDITALKEQFPHFRRDLLSVGHTRGGCVFSPVNCPLAGLVVVYVCSVMSSATCPGCHLWDRLRGRCTTRDLEVELAV